MAPHVSVPRRVAAPVFAVLASLAVFAVLADEAFEGAWESRLLLPALGALDGRKGGKLVQAAAALSIEPSPS